MINNFSYTKLYRRHIFIASNTTLNFADLRSKVVPYFGQEIVYNFDSFIYLNEKYVQI